MVFIQLTGKINEKGQLEVVLPKGLSPGEVQVTIEAPSASSWEEQPWTDEELADLMKVNPRTGTEIVEWLEQLESTGWEATPNTWVAR